MAVNGWLSIYGSNKPKLCLCRADAKAPHTPETRRKVFRIPSLTDSLSKLDVGILRFLTKLKNTFFPLRHLSAINPPQIPGPAKL